MHAVWSLQRTQSPLSFGNSRAWKPGFDAQRASRGWSHANHNEHVAEHDSTAQSSRLRYATALDSKHVTALASPSDMVRQDPAPDMDVSRAWVAAVNAAVWNTNAAS